MVATDASPLHTRPQVVVCIDDEPAILASLRRLFRREPFEFLATDKPDVAMGWIVQRHASVVVADQRMPSMTGLELLELVKSCSPTTMRVMLTGHSDVSGVLKIAKIEAIQKLIRKPWDDEELRRTVRELILEADRKAERSETE